MCYPASLFVQLPRTANVRLDEKLAKERKTDIRGISTFLQQESNLQMFQHPTALSQSHLQDARRTHLPEIPHVEKLEGVEELAVAHSKLVVAHLEERPDVLQAQKL